MSYLGRVTNKSSDIRRIDITSSTSATHTLTWTAPTEQSLIVTINGVKQQNNYTVSGTTLTLDTALLSSDKLEVIGINDIGTTITPAQGSVNTDQLATDAVTAAKLANSINTEITANTAKTGITSGQATAITANTAKVTNATHTGDVTGATALTIATDAVDIAMLSATGTASATTFLRGDNAWSAPSGGGLKFISDTDFSGTASTFDVTDCFSATYRNYLVVMDMICVQTETAHIYLLLGNSDLSTTETVSWELQMLGTNGTTDYKAVGGSDALGQKLVHQAHNSNMGYSCSLWINNPFGDGAGNITYTHANGEAYASGTAEGFWFIRGGASHGLDSVVSMRLTASGGMGYSGITGHVTVYGLAES